LSRVEFFCRVPENRSARRTLQAKSNKTGARQKFPLGASFDRAPAKEDAHPLCLARLNRDSCAGEREISELTQLPHPSRKLFQGGDRDEHSAEAIGAIQELSEEDVKFLEFAFVHDMPVQLQSRNPKQNGSASRLRYEKYKSATTLREVKSKGGTWKDILWDFSRGYIDFRHISGAAGMVELMRRRIDKGIALSPA
jgi:hypothetical protein